MKAKGSWRQTVQAALIHPAVSAAAVVLGLLLILLGEAVVRPVRARVKEAKAKIEAHAGAVKNLQTRFSEAERQDVEGPLEARRKAMPKTEAEMRAVMTALARFLKEAGWGAKLTPEAPLVFTDSLPELRVVRWRVEAYTPRKKVDQPLDSAEGRLITLLRRLDDISAPHLVNLLAVDLGGPNRDLRVTVEILFFQLP